MTLTLAAWFGRVLSREWGVTTRNAQDGPKPMKIEIERLPDYRWRDLGFPLPGGREDEG